MLLAAGLPGLLTGHADTEAVPTPEPWASSHEFEDVEFSLTFRFGRWVE